MVPSFSTNVQIHTELDARHLRCPLPLLKAKQAIHAMPAGAVLRVQATDAGSWRDFQVWSEQSGHRLLSCTEENQTYVYLLEKKHP